MRVTPISIIPKKSSSKQIGLNKWDRINTRQNKYQTDPESPVPGHSISSSVALALPNTAYSTGSTSRVSIVEETTPPITTVAKGRCTSAPIPVLSAIGMKPKLATIAVISTGRSRCSAAFWIASISGTPDSRSSSLDTRHACGSLNINQT